MAVKRKPRIPDIYKTRLALLRRSARRHKLSSLLLTHPADYFYMTGFTGEDSAVLITSREVHVISDGRFDESISQECPWVRRWMRTGLLDDEIAKVCKSVRISRLGVQPRHFSVASYETIKKRFHGLKVVHAPPLTEELRRHKDATELRRMRSAIRIAESSFEAMRRSIRLGDTELSLAARLEYEMKCRGASGNAFSTIVAEGPNAALPHAHPGKRKVKSSSALLFDWGARVDGYCSDLTRVVFIGSIPRKIGEIYGVVLEAQRRAIRSVTAGARLCDVDSSARTYIRDAGFGEYFNHGLGHGLGLDVHESPRISWQSDAVLKKGDVVTIEPGIYLPRIGGVRIEDDVVVTANGARVLSRLDKRLESAVIRVGGR